MDMNNLLIEIFDEWCKTLQDDETRTRYESFIAYKKFAAACLVFHDVDIEMIDESHGWNDDLTVFRVCDGVELRNKCIKS